MGKGTELSLSQVEKLVADDPKGKANLRKLLSGEMKVYCAAVRKKVKIPKANLKFSKHVVRNGRIAVRAYGKTKDCVTSEGKVATAGTFIANLAGSGRGKSVRRSKSRGKSRKRKGSKSRKRKSSKSKKRKGSKSRKRRSRRRH